MLRRASRSSGRVWPVKGLVEALKVVIVYPALGRELSKLSLSNYLRKKLGKRSKVDDWRLRPEILMHPTIPEPMHGLAPRTILGSSWWDKERQAAYRSTRYHCIACAVHKTNTGQRWLEGHEVYDIDYLQGLMTYLKTVPLCKSCHMYIHRGRLSALLEAGTIIHATFISIIRHGDRVLHAVGLQRPEPYTGPLADWGDWRLVLAGHKYLPLHKDFEAYKKFYADH